jgi:ABC-type transport system involved in multi-copper enzyme maturation permease subunit
MTRLVRTELLKLATMRLTYGLLAVAAALSALFSLLENNGAGTAGSGVPPISTADGLRTVTTVTGFAMLFAAVLGSIVANGEFRHSTATLTYLATPQRTRVLLAKVIASSCVGSLFGLVAGISAGTLVGHVAGAVAGAALLAALGAAVGSLVRSQLATVIGIFVWAIIIESLIGGLYTSTRPYLPYTAATTLAGTKLGSAAFGPAHGLNGGDPLPFVAGAALIAAFAAAAALIAARTTVRRDIT